MEKITLLVLQSIFENETKSTLSTKAKTVYLNCLMNEYEKRVVANIPNDLSGFHIDNDFQPSVYLSVYEELNRANLIVIEKKILFPPLWLKYMIPDVVLNNGLGLIDRYSPELTEGSQHFKESICMKQKITMERCEFLIKCFITEQQAVKQTYSNVSEVLKHCRNWIAKQPKSTTSLNNYHKL